MIRVIIDMIELNEIFAIIEEKGKIFAPVEKNGKKI